MEYRVERDSMGEMQVPADRYWGAQTQRSYQNFADRRRRRCRVEIVRAFGDSEEGGAAVANNHIEPGKAGRRKRLGLPSDGSLRRGYCGQAGRPLPAGGVADRQRHPVQHERQRGRRQPGQRAAGKKLLHPNDHVNMSQSSNDTFPTAMHIAAVVALEDKLFPRHGRADCDVQAPGGGERGRGEERAAPTCRTRRPSPWPRRSAAGATMPGEGPASMLELALAGLRELALGGTAVGTGLNAPKGFDEAVAKVGFRADRARPSSPPPTSSTPSPSKDELVFAHGALKALAGDMMKIANDVRWLASGPRRRSGRDSHSRRTSPAPPSCPARSTPPSARR